MNPVPFVLAAPDFGALDTLGRRPQPAALWSVGSTTLAGLWLEHAVREGHKAVVLHAPDRPDQVRTELGGGAYWSLQLTVSSQPAPPEAQSMLSLPGGEARAAAMDAAGVLRWWLALNQEWLAGRQTGPVSVDRPQPDGGWIGPHAQIHPGCTFHAPYWVGARTIIGPGCTIGPGALVGEDCLLDQDIHVENSLVLARTSLGPHLDVRGVIVAGPVLLDPPKGVRVDIVDRFIADALQRPAPSVAWSDRLLATLLWLPALIAAAGRATTTGTSVTLPHDDTLSLRTGANGSLLARRSGWLRHVIAGRMRLIGPLPRTTTNTALLPAESRQLLATVAPGMFSLADLHGIHDVTDPEEIAHALYQAAVPAADRAVRRQLVKLCLTRPLASP